MISYLSSSILFTAADNVVVPINTELNRPTPLQGAIKDLYGHEYEEQHKMQLETSIETPLIWTPQSGPLTGTTVFGLITRKGAEEISLLDLHRNLAEIYDFAITSAADEIAIPRLLYDFIWETQEGLILNLATINERKISTVIYPPDLDDDLPGYLPEELRIIVKDIRTFERAAGTRREVGV